MSETRELVVAEAAPAAQDEVCRAIGSTGAVFTTSAGFPFDAVVEIEFRERFLKEIIYQVATQTLSPKRAASMIVRTFERRAEGTLCTLSAMAWLRKDILEECSSDMGLDKEQCVRLFGCGQTADHGLARKHGDAIVASVLRIRALERASLRARLTSGAPPPASARPPTPIGATAAAAGGDQVEAKKLPSTAKRPGPRRPATPPPAYLLDRSFKNRASRQPSGSDPSGGAGRTAGSRETQPAISQPGPGRGSRGKGSRRGGGGRP